MRFLQGIYTNCRKSLIILNGTSLLFSNSSLRQVRYGVHAPRFDLVELGQPSQLSSLSGEIHFSFPPVWLPLQLSSQFTN